MADATKGDLLPRRQLLKEYGFSHSAERRGRAGGSWPPHLTIGRKIYYLRGSVEQWLVEQERSTWEGPVAGPLFPAHDEDIYRLAKELVESAPTLSREQLDSILAIVRGTERDK